MKAKKPKYPKWKKGKTVNRFDAESMESFMATLNNLRDMDEIRRYEDLAEVLVAEFKPPA